MSKQAIYLDNSATTPLLPAVKAAMCEAMERYGNPSSLHTAGDDAARALRAARAAVGEALGERFLKDGQLVFTGSGTEATALALYGTALAKSRRTASTILTTDCEHPATAEPLKYLESIGFTVVRVPTAKGVLDMETVRTACTGDLFMVSMMLVNNETGARFPVEDVFRMARAANPDCICHTDAVQGFLKVPMTVRSLGADLITVSAHKIHGPKGVGALYIAEHLLKSKRIVPVLRGGGQEFGLRSGTENTVGITGFATAAKIVREGLVADSARIGALSEQLIAGLRERGLQINLPPVRTPHIVNFTLPDIKSETMLHHLSAAGVYVSSGSACSSHAKHPSTALIAFGLTAHEADCSLRVSLSRETTAEDIEALLTALDAGLAHLVRIRK